MFRKILIVSVLLFFFLYSCSSFENNTESSQENNETISVKTEEKESDVSPVKPTIEVDAVLQKETEEKETTAGQSEPESILIPGLMWSEPEEYNQQFILIADLPKVALRKMAEAVETETVEEVAAEVKEEVVAERSPSFLELLFKPGTEKAEDKSETKIPLEEKTAEPEIIEEKNLENEKQTDNPEEESPAVIESREPDAEVIEAEAIEREMFITAIDGEGWLFESFKTIDGLETDSLRYSGREYLNGETVFSFFPYSAGRYKILLRKPDFSSGKTARAVINLEVMEMLSEAPSLEKFEAEFADEEQEEKTTPVINDVQEILTPGELKTAAEKLVKAGGCREAADLILDNIDGMEWTELDYFYFMLAGLFETCPGIRDERAAAGYYRKIIDYYPVSVYWTDSKERIAYLERNFIYIR